MEFDYEHQELWPGVQAHTESPVALDSSQAQPLTWQRPDFKPVGTACEQTSKTFYVKGHGSYVLDGRLATFSQLHFHCGGEHVIDGLRAPMEAHFVHTFADGQPAVVGIQLVLGEANPIFDQVLTAIETGTLTAALPLGEFLPQGEYLNYRGSLTTPPVLEGVAWYLAMTPVTISEAQLAAYQAVFPGDNHRALQPLVGQPVLRLHD